VQAQVKLYTEKARLDPKVEQVIQTQAPTNGVELLAKELKQSLKTS
jgi:hypothetical protein